MSLDRRTGQTLLLIVLCAFATWMWASGETLRYLGPRTSWLVPFAAVALALLVLASVHAGRRDVEAVPLTRRDALGFAALALPVAMAVLLAHTQLGAQAASKKLASRGIDTSALADLASGSGSGLDFLQLSVAQKDRRFAAERGIVPGKEVRLLGFVSKPSESPRASFELSRFYITCCVADSIPFGVSVMPPAGRSTRASKNRWLSVTGSLVRRHGGRLVVQAQRVRQVKPPRHPYLYVAN